ncbi:penicillin-binding transpeptidase domain-containing protein [Solirubrobacter phytolaccae]|uniref:Beta-lactamase n=1 Tax=Solirubrobacter phytolaccae TaxID=1404360 RepID=A0A9X3SDE5_9ACTN|nr:penicillin-binding transpeptidase domain-containing protein [Solirubrobacter phytolaccae]MDA0185661.1 penicillin-binding transpeptidase domain-containing protein [Solirubrobacter phytolaccae]
MHRFRKLLSTLALTLAVPTAAAHAAPVQRPDLERHFTAAGTTGTMVVQRSGHRPRTWVVGERSAQRFLPSSTFKIPNALLAIDRGVASGADQPYPGPNPNVLVDGAPFLPVVCEGDLTLATALANSCIPIFQRIARQVGLRTYTRELARMDYGNHDMAGAQVDRFWLDGPLAISAREQVEFLRRLERGALPVSRRAVHEVQDMLVLERDKCGVLRGKTGYVFTTAPRVGWWVGWVERGEDTYTFALNLDITRPEHPAARMTIGRAILGELGALGASC